MITPPVCPSDGPLIFPESFTLLWEAYNHPPPTLSPSLLKWHLILNSEYPRSFLTFSWVSPVYTWGTHVNKLLFMFLLLISLYYRGLGQNPGGWTGSSLSCHPSPSRPLSYTLYTGNWHQVICVTPFPSLPSDHGLHSLPQTGLSYPSPTCSGQFHSLLLIKQLAVFHSVVLWGFLGLSPSTLYLFPFDFYQPLASFFIIGTLLNAAVVTNRSF